MNIFRRKRSEPAAPTQEQLAEKRRALAEEHARWLEEEAAKARARDLMKFEAYAPEIGRLFSEYPEVLDWNGESMDLLWLMIQRKEDHRPFSIIGRIILDADGNILRFEERGGNIVFEEMSPSLPVEMRKSQLTGLLRDSDEMARYCEQVAATLLEEGTCVFNAPFGLKANESEYMSRYGSRDWVEAWTLALSEEFQAKTIIPQGKGCFRMEAI